MHSLIFKRHLWLGLNAGLVLACSSTSDPSADVSAGGSASAGTSSAGAAGSGPFSNGGTAADSSNAGNTGLGGSGGSNAAAGSSAGGSSSAGTGSGGATSGCTPTMGTTGDAAGDQTPGTWVDCTPAELAGAYVNTIVVDPVKQSDMWVHVDHQGSWKSTDYGFTWTKVSTGDMASGTGAWSAAIEQNPCRDPETPPALYIPQGYGMLNLWKSTDGGVTWNDIWSNRIFAPDGVTNISSDVGGDVAGIQTVDPNDSDYLVAYLHGYGGSGDNNGIFVTTDGGQKWIVHKAETFSFQPHNSLLRVLDANTWIVSPGTVSSEMSVYRTTDGATTWNDIGDAPQRGMGHILARAGTTFYTGADYTNGVAKSTDGGASWTSLPNTGGKVSWVVTTATTVYASDGYDASPLVRRASLADDSTWTSEAAPGGMTDNGSFAVVASDGTHYVIVAAQHTAGIWRYLEP